MKINTGSFWSQLPNKYSIANSQPKYPEQFKVLYNFVPKWEIVQAYKDKEITWEEYTQRYISELENISNLPIKTFIRQSLEDICAIDNIDEITLCCWESEDNLHCHRKILFELLPEEYRGVCK